MTADPFAFLSNEMCHFGGGAIPPAPPSAVRCHTDQITISVKRQCHGGEAVGVKFELETAEGSV